MNSPTTISENYLRLIVALVVVSWLVMAVLPLLV